MHNFGLKRTNIEGGGGYNVDGGVRAMDGERDGEGEAALVTNKAYRRDKSIVPRLYATNPRYNVLPSHPSTASREIEGREGVEKDVPYARNYRTTDPEAPLPSIIPFLYRVASLRNNRLNEDTLLSL